MKGEKNVYTCDKCGEYTVTVDKDEGVTPFTIRCRAKDHPIKGGMTIVGCAGRARSACYRLAGVLGSAYSNPEWEWYHPDADEMKRWAAHRFGPDVVDHVERGGLLLRHIATGSTDLAAD
jgi:hypothetical protein